MPVRDIQSFRFKDDHNILLDTNVLYSTFGPSPIPRRSGAYSEAIKNMRIGKSKMYLDILVLSEFMNRYARDLYNLKLEDYKDAGIPKEDWPKFKEFRDDPDFKPLAEEIRIAASDIINTVTECCNPAFNKAKANLFLHEYGKCRVDFNDQVMADMCNDAKFFLATDDGDFKDYPDITILTANLSYFK